MDIIEDILNIIINIAKQTNLLALNATIEAARTAKTMVYADYSPAGVMPTNMYIEEGEYSLEDMISSIDEGILITDIQGLHAGINATSGDFSLSSNGYLIKHGKIIKPVNQITIAGNFYKILKDIKALGKDTRFSFLGTNYFGSPSIKIDSLVLFYHTIPGVQ